MLIHINKAFYNHVLNDYVFFSFFPLIHDTSPPVVSMDIFNLSTGKLVTTVDFSKSPYSSTLTHLHGFCSLFNVVRMKQMMHTVAHLDEVVNTHSIIVFAQTTVSMEVNPQMEVVL